MASTVGIAVLDAIKEDKLQENSGEVGTYLMKKLEGLRDEFEVNFKTSTFPPLTVLLLLLQTVRLQISRVD